MNTVTKPSRTLFTYIEGTLKGAGQVMFQGSAWTGLFIMIGIFWGAYGPAGESSPLVAWGALVGLVASTAAGYLFESKSDGDQGLWGFNGILVGCAVFTFLGNTVWAWVMTVLGAGLTVIARRGFNNVFAPFNTTSYTFPFIAVSWFILLSARMMGQLPPVGESIAALPTHVDSTALTFNFADLVVYWLKGIAQVFLINSWVTGIFFIVGLAICSRWAAAWAMIASALSLFVAIVFNANHSDIVNGLFGFSPVLTGIALGCTFYRPGVKSFFYTLAGIIATVFIQAALDAFLSPVGIATLTAPFCIATWIFMLPMYKLIDNKKSTAK